MLKVYKYNMFTGKIICLKKFQDIYGLCEYIRSSREYDDIPKYIGYSPYEKTEYKCLIFGNFGYFEYDYNYYYKYVIYDHNAKLITPDYIVGCVRWYVEYYFSDYNLRRGIYSRRNGRKRRPFAGYRSPRTTNERKQAYDTYVEEYDITITIRGKRSFSHLSNIYDDIYAHTDKSWKTQSKRKKQWKPK